MQTNTALIRKFTINRWLAKSVFANVAKIHFFAQTLYQLCISVKKNHILEFTLINVKFYVDLGNLYFISFKIISLKHYSEEHLTSCSPKRCSPSISKLLGNFQKKPTSFEVRKKQLYSLKICLTIVYAVCYIWSVNVYNTWTF